MVVEHRLPDLAPRALDRGQLVLPLGLELALVLVPQRRLPPLQQRPQLDQTALALPRRLVQAQTPNQVPNLFQAVFQQSLHQDQ